MKILCLGDSIMQYNDCTSYPQTGWVQCLDRFFVPGIQILNFARNGRSTKSFLSEGRLELVLEQAAQGDFALIQFAHNDEKINDPARYASPEKGGDFQKNLSFMVKALAEKGVKSILLTPVTRRKFSQEHVIQNTHSVYPESIKEIAAELNIPCIDMTALTTEFFEKLGEEKSRRYFMNFAAGMYENFEEGKSDDSHLRPDGAFAVSKIFAAALAALSEDWKDYVPLKSSLALSGIYNENKTPVKNDREIDDEHLMWK